jgi:spore coat protein A, manganese oxidase
MNRWLCRGAFAALAVGAAVAGVGAPLASATPLNPATLTKYIDPLPIPPVAQQSAPGHYDMTMMQGTTQFSSQLPATPVWGYGGGYLGPTIEERTGNPITVTWFNNLPTTHLLAPFIDYTLDGAMQGPDVRAVTHLHGGHVAPDSDGGPDAWFLPGQQRTYDYPNDQDATTLWYHDHAMGITRLNPYAGLAGFYIVRDAYEDSLNLPKGAYEVPLVIQDKLFNTDGTLTYPGPGITHPLWLPEMFGDAIAVNGKLWPYLNVEPRKYRFRLLNGSNARFYSLTISGPAITKKVKLQTPFNQIGAEGGLLPTTATTNQLLIAPGERADVIVDFTNAAGLTLTLRNTAKAPYPAGAAPDPQTTAQIMQFRVAATANGPDTSVIPANPRPVAKLDPAQAAATRDIKMTEIIDPVLDEPFQLQLEDKMYRDPIDIFPKLGTTEVWQFINTTGDTHPMHLHLVQFQVLSRQSFDVGAYLETGSLRLLGTARAPDANEMGWKDTVRVDPGQVVRIIARFDHLGNYPVHCHILEHEENEMMRPFEVVP